MLKLRKAAGEDEPFLRALFAAGQPALAALSALPDGLVEHLLKMQYEARRAQYHSRWTEAVQQVIDWRGGDAADRDAPCPQAVGALWADHGADAIHVLDIAVMPAWRGQGVATLCLQQLLAAAAGHNMPVTLQVALDNPARQLYERLGFVPAADDDGVNLLMIRWPASSYTRRPPAPEPTEMCHEQA